MMNLKSSKEEVSNPSELKVVEAEVVMESPEVLKVKSRPVKKVDVRKMAIIGVLAAISIMLSMTPFRVYSYRTNKCNYNAYTCNYRCNSRRPFSWYYCRIYIWSDKFIKSAYYAYNNFFCIYKSIGIYITKDAYRCNSLLCL